MDALEIYNKLSRPPVDALRQIEAGKLRGKTDINPQWRYKAMTETFGLVGQGWKYEIQKLWTAPGAGTEVLAFAQVAVYVKQNNEWSEPIIGIGGSKLVMTEKGQPVSNDEGFKMAVTDAFSTSLKMLGVAADIYAGKWNGSKYTDGPQNPPRQQNQQRPQNPPRPQNQPKQQNQQQPKSEGQQLYDLGIKVGNLLQTVSPSGYPLFNEQEAEDWQSATQEKYKSKDLEGLKDVVSQLEDCIARRIAEQQAQVVQNVMGGEVYAQN